MDSSLVYNTANVSLDETSNNCEVGRLCGSRLVGCNSNQCTGLDISRVEFCLYLHRLAKCAFTCFCLIRGLQGWGRGIILHWSLFCHILQRSSQATTRNVACHDNLTAVTSQESGRRELNCILVNIWTLDCVFIKHVVVVIQSRVEDKCKFTLHWRMLIGRG
jgi:hypothetical protein